MTRLFAWFPQAGRLEVAIPDGYTAEQFRADLTAAGGGNAWVDLVDGSRANLRQVVRLELVEDARG